MIGYYGYKDGSGEYFVIIDAAKCNGCRKCIDACPSKALDVETVLIDLEDKAVATVKEQKRKEIKYVCASCKHGQDSPCVKACEQKAINTVWTSGN